MRGERCQTDLFTTEMPTLDLDPGLRVKLAPLLQALLSEAADLGRLTAGSSLSSTESRNDQDHA
jgi:hypothetical protein